MRICLTVTFIWGLALSLDVAAWTLFFREHVNIRSRFGLGIDHWLTTTHVGRHTAPPIQTFPNQFINKPKQVPPQWVSMTRIITLRSVGLIDAIILGNLFGVRFGLCFWFVGGGGIKICV